MRDDDLKLVTPEHKEPDVTIKTLIIMDYMGGSDMTPEEEAAHIAEQFDVLHGIRLNYDFSSHANDIWREYKLIIMDYGGAAGMGADDTIVYQFREVTRWAEEHPSRLVLFWTSCTSRFWHWEIKDEFEDLANVLFYDPVNEHGEAMRINDSLFDHQDQVIQTIKTILG